MVTAPKISIITPSYNQDEFIEETIKSVISQEGDFFLEYLVMDGGSTYNSVEIIKKYDSLIKEGKYLVKCNDIKFTWSSEKDNGQADAVNKGFKAASGDILGWLNSDDTYLPGAFAKVTDYFKIKGDVMMVYGEGYLIGRNSKIKERYYTESFDLKRLAEICFISQPTVFLRRGVLDKCGYLDEALHFCMDYEYWMRLALKGLTIGFIPENLANTRTYAETKTSSNQIEINYEIIKVLKKHFGYVPKRWIDTYLCLLIDKWLGRKKREWDFLHMRRYRLMKWLFMHLILRVNSNECKNDSM